MKKKNLVLVLGLAALFAACSNESDLVSDSVPSPTVTSLNLQSMDYNDLAGILSGVSYSDQVVKLDDDSNSWTVKLKKKQNMKVNECGHSVDFFSGQTSDSISGVLSPNYATLRFQRNGELISYVAYRDNEKMMEVANYYRSQYLPNISTRSALLDEIVMCHGGDTRSGSNVANVRINITKAIANSPFKPSLDNDCLQSEQNYSCGTKSLIEPIDNEFDPSLEFMLIKERDGNCLDHEITWQIESVSTSLEFLINSGFIVPIYTILDCTYHSPANEWGGAIIDYFQKYLRSWTQVSGQGWKPFILIRNGDWDNGNYVGMASMGMIHNAKPYSNFEAGAVSSISSLHPHTLAHEIGHMFGAEHISYNDTDLMYPHVKSTVTPHHKSADNWDRMLQCWIKKFP